MLSQWQGASLELVGKTVAVIGLKGAGCYMKIELLRSATAATAKQGSARSPMAFTLAEVVVAMAITVMALAGIILGYLMAARQAVEPSGGRESKNNERWQMLQDYYLVAPK